jgi:hypothetical protein
LRHPVNPGLANVSSRLAYTLQANVFAVLPLLIGIMAVGNDRFLSEAIDPTLQQESRAMQVNGRVVENTLQQFLMFCPRNVRFGSLADIAASSIGFSRQRVPV